ncbi:MAG: primosomal protein N' [Hyphomonadaceae bacterium]|nr:primosomal protein N' [Hyphomonadaceae bacterium]
MSSRTRRSTLAERPPTFGLFEPPESRSGARSLTKRRARVLLPLALPEPFDYRVPADMEVAPGDHVIAPVGTRDYLGVVWSVEESEAADNLKALIERLPGPPLPANTRRFLDWMARYVVAPPGTLLRMIVRSAEALLDPPTITLFAPSDAPFEGKMTDARAAVLRAAAEESGTMADLARRADVSAGVVKALVEQGALQRILRSEDPPYPEPDLDREGQTLSPDQARAAEAIRQSIAAGGFSATLLDGVTGSGKTEVYLEAVAEALRRDPTAQALVLLPEIALTQAVLARFEARFGVKPVEWHSAISQKSRRRAWREIAAGRARLIAGARSALFLPYPNLKLIVIDEEHDGSYKQDDGIAYQARDLAVARAKIENCAIVLASATPSLETLHNALTGRYAHVKLPARVGAATLPDVELVDLRLDPPDKGAWLSPKLVRAIAETLIRGEQSLLYMNRRGYAPLTLCRACGERMQSPDTQSWLVEHKYSGRLVCHLTGFSMPKPKECPKCLAPDSFVSIGPGVERIEEEIRNHFPDQRIEVFSSDTAPNGEAVRAIVERMEQGEIDILIGTQIVAKGHNFPMLTFVGVVDADLGLKGGDLRAGERTFQLVSQVAGRAGRAERKGRAMIQTYAAEEPVMQALAAMDRDGFLSAEADMRKLAGMPPFGRLGALIVAAPNEALANESARALGEAAPNADKVDVWGPAPAPIAVVRGQHRRRFLVRADREVDLSAFVAAWTSRVKLHSAVRLQIDIDPYSFL